MASPVWEQSAAQLWLRPPGRCQMVGSAVRTQKERKTSAQRTLQVHKRFEHMTETTAPPPTVIIVHPKERLAKCTVAWLKGDPRFQFFRGPRRPNDLGGYVRLAMEGPELSVADAQSGLLVLDGTWKLVDRLAPNVQEVPTRRLPPVQTAYPRTSKVSTDPDGGLATIEAVYTALRILRRDITGLLAHYHWGEEFLQLNADFWDRMGV